MTDTMTLRSITEATRVQVLEVRASPDQERFVGSIREALEEAAAYHTPSPGIARSISATSRSGS